MGGIGRTPAALRTARTAATTTSPATESSPAHEWPTFYSVEYTVRKMLVLIHTDALECAGIVGNELAREIPRCLGKIKNVERIEDEHNQQLDHGVPFLDQPFRKPFRQPFWAFNEVALSGRCLLRIICCLARSLCRQSLRTVRWIAAPTCSAPMEVTSAR
jgi:hypothetical protein